MIIYKLPTSDFEGLKDTAKEAKGGQHALKDIIDWTIVETLEQLYRSVEDCRTLAVLISNARETIQCT